MSEKVFQASLRRKSLNVTKFRRNGSRETPERESGPEFAFPENIRTFVENDTAMSKKTKLALLALLGFATACSTVKNGTKGPEKEEDTQMVEPTIRVLYGVRPPVAVDPETPVSETPATDTAAPKK